MGSNVVQNQHTDTTISRECITDTEQERRVKMAWFGLQAEPFYVQVSWIWTRDGQKQGFRGGTFTENPSDTLNDLHLRLFKQIFQIPSTFSESETLTIAKRMLTVQYDSTPSCTLNLWTNISYLSFYEEAKKQFKKKAERRAKRCPRRETSSEPLPPDATPSPAADDLLANDENLEELAKLMSSDSTEEYIENSQVLEMSQSFMHC